MEGSINTTQSKNTRNCKDDDELIIKEKYIKGQFNEAHGKTKKTRQCKVVIRHIRNGV